MKVRLRYRRFILIYMVALIYKVAASILDAFWVTHLHYCQRTTASENWFPRPAGYDLETDRKRDKCLSERQFRARWRQKVFSIVEWNEQPTLSKFPLVPRRNVGCFVSG